jgi:hypothetical protein
MGESMRTRSIAAAVFAISMVPVAASAADPPDSVLFAGYITPKTVNPSANGTWCMVDGRTSTFVHSATPLATLISFSEIIYTTAGSLGPTAYSLGGQARLVFSGSAAGKINFDANSSYPGAVYHPNFNGYTQSYNAATNTLTVHFKIVFAGCTLPVTATYRK